MLTSYDKHIKLKYLVNYTSMKKDLIFMYILKVYIECIKKLYILNKIFIYDKSASIVSYVVIEQ